jgi:hypothetical protein
MGDEAPPPPELATHLHMPPAAVHKGGTTASSATEIDHDHNRVSSESDGPLSPRLGNNPFSRVQTSLDMDDYFVGL